MTGRTHRTTRWTSRAVVLPVIAAMGLGAGAGRAYAGEVEPIAITSYDITDAPAAGSGGWSWFYSGTFSPTRIDPVQGGTVGDYTGGSGTLNDGVLSTRLDQTHLFWSADRGQPQLTLHLAELSTIDNIEIYGGYIGGNAIPGGIEHVTVTIAGASASVPTEAFGPLNALGTPSDDRASLEGTPLTGMSTDTVMLSDFVTGGFILDQFSITEIVVNGQPAATPPVAVEIDILPGLRLNIVISHLRLPIPVAIHSSPTFDAPADIDQQTLTFGRTGTESSLLFCGRPRDVDRDARADVVCWFSVWKAGFQRGDTVAFLRGSTMTGQAIEGMDAVWVF